MTELKGSCLCGAVQLTVARHDSAMSACHCRMCRRWSGGAMFAFDAPKEAVTVSGPVRIYTSSSFAERAFCGTCGAQLWIHDTRGPGQDMLELSPGPFDGGDLHLVREIYADCNPHGYAFAGDHPRITKAQYEAENPSV